MAEADPVTKTSTVRTLNPDLQLKTFFEKIFGSRTGFICLGTEVNGELVKEFFEWPTKTEEIIAFITEKKSEHDVYFCPSLLKKPEATPGAFAGSFVVCLEFDSDLPTADSLLSVPNTTIKVRTSTNGHEHWYWRLKIFNSDVKAVEEATNKLAYQLEADLTDFDPFHFLRVPCTKHQETGRDVFISEESHTQSAIETFLSLPEVPIQKFGSKLPDSESLMFRYHWPVKAERLYRLKRNPSKPKRLLNLRKLSYELAEMGMSDEEILSLLINADNRWEHFKSRGETVQRARLWGLVKRARLKHPLRERDGYSNTLPVYSFGEFMARDIQIDWFIKDLIALKGMMVISAPPNVGKTTFGVEFAMHLALARDYLKWEIERPVKSMFLSLEMGDEEVRILFDSLVLKNKFTKEEYKKINENFTVIPIGETIPLDKITEQERLEEMLDSLPKERVPEFILIDSMGSAIAGDINSDVLIRGLFAWVEKHLRNGRSMTIAFVHHNRKAQVGNEKPNKLADLYGSTFIGARATTVIGLWAIESTGEVEVSCIKLRSAKRFETFRIKRPPVGNGFIVSGDIGPLPKGWTDDGPEDEM